MHNYVDLVGQEVTAVLTDEERTIEVFGIVMSADIDLDDRGAFVSLEIAGRPGESSVFSTDHFISSVRERILMPDWECKHCSTTNIAEHRWCAGCTAVRPFLLEEMK